jgi:YVTN family beta-propeller protein
MISNSSFISVIDGNTNKILDNIELNQQPFDIAIDENTNMVYTVSKGDKSIISVTDGNTNKILDNIELNQQPFDIAIDENTNMVVNQHTNRLYIVANINGSSSFPDSDGGIEIPRGILYTIDTKANRILSVLELISPRGLDVNINTNRIYTIDSFNKIVYSIDGYNNGLISEAMYTGNLPTGIAVNSDTGKIYVADSFDNSVYIFSELS